MLTLNDLDLVKWDKPTLPPIVTVLRALYLGMEVDIAGYRCRLAHTKDGGEKIVIITHEDRILGADLSIEELSIYANKMTEEDLLKISVNIGFNSYKQSERKDRSRVST
jgi:hypothetical protein